MFPPTAIRQLLLEQKLSASNDSDVILGKTSSQKARNGKGGAVVKADSPNRLPRSVGSLSVR